MSEEQKTENTEQEKFENEKIEEQQNNDLLVLVDKKVSQIEELLIAQKSKQDNLQTLLDNVHEERTKYRDNFFTDKFQKPLIKDLILLYDNIKNRVENAEIENTKEELQFVLDDLVSVLERMEVVTYKNYFEPDDYPYKRDIKLHKVVGFTETEKEDLNNFVESIVKDGFLWNDVVIRPENVKLFNTKNN